MQVDANLKRNFPRLAAWIAHEIPKCRYDPRIWSAFLEFSELDEDDAASALADAGTPPTIDVGIMLSDGQYRPRFKRNREKIFVSRRLCRRFENTEADYRIMKPHDLLMKAVILHEMIHWADAKDGTKQPDVAVFDPETGETKKRDVGFQFEMRAFYGIYTRELL